ncbi:MAG: hypothetical protein EGP73_12875 [Alistipes indistinctus]|nr:hypothetical protein [Alistipes indistinctus]MBD9135726.1 hypothetical protein [Alistipes indistinctus]
MIAAFLNFFVYPIVFVFEILWLENLGCLPPAVVSARMQFIFSGKRRIGYCTAVLAMIVCG